MFYDTVTRISLLFMSYEIITLDIVKAKLIDIFLDKIIYIIIGILIYTLGYFTNSCCNCICYNYSQAEKDILNLIKAGDKMDKLNNSGGQYYQEAILQYNKTIPFQNISKKTINKINDLSEIAESGAWSNRKKKTKKRSD